jgi:hypothetical protein
VGRAGGRALAEEREEDRDEGRDGLIGVMGGRGVEGGGPGGGNGGVLGGFGKRFRMPGGMGEARPCCCSSRTEGGTGIDISRCCRLTELRTIGFASLESSRSGW